MRLRALTVGCVLGVVEVASADLHGKQPQQRHGSVCQVGAEVCIANFMLTVLAPAL